MIKLRIERKKHQKQKEKQTKNKKNKNKKAKNNKSNNGKKYRTQKLYTLPGWRKSLQLQLLLTIAFLYESPERTNVYNKMTFSREPAHRLQAGGFDEPNTIRERVLAYRFNLNLRNTGSMHFASDYSLSAFLLHVSSGA